MNTPKIRFNGFQGEWIKKPMESLGNFKKGASLSKSDLSKEGEPCILYGELYTTYGSVIEKVKSKTDRKEKNFIYGEKNDVLIPSSGETAYDIACASALNISKVILGGDLNIFTPIKEIDGRFISYQINGVRKNKLSKLAQGASVVHLYSNALKSFELYFPSFEEQSKISNFLCLIDLRIEKQSTKIEYLELFKKGIMQKIFSQELRFKDEDGGEFGDWEECTFSSLLKSVPTKPYQILASQIMNSGKYEVVDQGKSIIAGYSNSVEKVFNEGAAIVYGDHTTVVKFRDIPFIIGADGTKILTKIKDSDSLKYLYFALSFFNVEPEGYKRHFSILKNIQLPVPVKREQQKIADYLSAIDKKLKSEIEKLMELEKQKSGFMQRMFI